MKPLLVFYGVKDLSIFPELNSVLMDVICVPPQEDILSVEFPRQPGLILCQTLGTAEEDLEMAQVFRMNSPEARIFLIQEKSFSFDKVTMRKNGFDDAFLLPWEKASLLSTIEATSLYLRNPKLINYTPIFLVDFDVHQTLDFDVFIYLPMNCILVPLARKGEQMTPEKLEKARDTFQNVAYIHKSEMPAFKEYYQKVSQARGESGSSESEKLMEFEKTCRELLSNIFVDNLQQNTFTRSGQLMEELKKILDQYVSNRKNRSIEKVLTVLMNRPSAPYNHAIHVALYAALFGSCLNFPRPFDLALAGLLHDLGLSELPERFFTMAPQEVAADQAQPYARHPQLTIELLQKRKMALNDNIFKAILHHHDAFSEKLSLNTETRLLAIADEFDYLTRQNAGEKALSPAQALNLLVEKTAANPGAMRLDLGMLKEIVSAMNLREAR